MRQIASTTTLILALGGTSACGDEVPIGQGDPGTGGTAAAASGGAAGNAGSGAAAGSGAFGGSGGSGALGGSGGSGGSGALGGSGGAGATGGSAGAGATGGSGGTTGQCPTNTSNVVRTLTASSATDLLLEQNLLYYVEATPQGSISSVALPSGNPTTLASAALFPTQIDAFDNPDSMAKDATHLYWRAAEGRSMWRMPLSGGAPQKLAEITINFPSGTTVGMRDSVTVSATHAYWAQGPNPASGQEVEFRIYRVPLTGGSAEMLGSWVSDGNDINKGFQPLSLVVDASNLHFTLTAGGGSQLMRLATSGGSASELLGVGHFLTQDATTVFATSSGIVWTIDKATKQVGGLTTGIDVTDVFELGQGLAVQGQSLYRTATGTSVSSGLECCQCGWVTQMPKTGTNVAHNIVWSGKGRPSAIVASPDAVVFTDIDNHEVVVLKP